MQLLSTGLEITAGAAAAASVSQRYWRSLVFVEMQSREGLALIFMVLVSLSPLAFCGIWIKLRFIGWRTRACQKTSVFHWICIHAGPNLNSACIYYHHTFAFYLFNSFWSPFAIFKGPLKRLKSWWWKKANQNIFQICYCIALLGWTQFL